MIFSKGIVPVLALAFTATNSFYAAADTPTINGRRLLPHESIARALGKGNGKGKGGGSGNGDNRGQAKKKVKIAAREAGTSNTLNLDLVVATSAITSSTTTSTNGQQARNIKDTNIDDKLVIDPGGINPEDMAIISINSMDDVHGILIQGKGKGKEKGKSMKISQKHGMETFATPEAEFTAPAWSCGMDQLKSDTTLNVDEETERRLIGDGHHSHAHGHGHEGHTHHHHDHEEHLPHAHDHDHDDLDLSAIKQNLRGTNIRLGKRRQLQEGLGYTYQVDMFLEIDVALCQANGETCSNGVDTNTMNYIDALFAGANTIYEEEIDTHLNVLHIEVTDRYNSFGWGQTSNALNAMMQHFSGHTADFPNSIAPAPWTWHHPNTDLHHALLGNMMGGGIAYVGVLCNAGYGFGLSANMVGSYQTMNEAVVWDMTVFLHEVGHNFDSGHTHQAYTPQIDTCGSTCPSGLPLARSATIMSYCHLCSGSYSNMDYTFGGKPNGGDRTQVLGYDRTSTLVNGISTEPERVNAKMYTHVSTRGSCLDVPTGPQPTTPPGTASPTTTNPPTPAPVIPTLPPTPAPPTPLACNTSHSDNTANYGPSDMPSCGTSIGTNGAKWYKVTGATAGQIVTLTTCNQASFDTKLSVWADKANSGTCIAGNDDTCGYQSTVSFIANAAYVANGFDALVHGYGSAQGDFTVTATCADPTSSPTKNPTSAPVTSSPTLSPSKNPTKLPTSPPTNGPTSAPETSSPTLSPSKNPTKLPTSPPTNGATSAPVTSSPTLSPSKNPTKLPTSPPTNGPTSAPESSSPTLSPSKNPTKLPTSPPTNGPTSAPTTSSPTQSPSKNPTKLPTSNPTTANPTTSNPTSTPTKIPTNSPVAAPTDATIALTTPEEGSTSQSADGYMFDVVAKSQAVSVLNMNLYFKVAQCDYQMYTKLGGSVPGFDDPNAWDLIGEGILTRNDTISTSFGGRTRLPDGGFTPQIVEAGQTRSFYLALLSCSDLWPLAVDAGTNLAQGVAAEDAHLKLMEGIKKVGGYSSVTGQWPGLNPAEPFGMESSCCCSLGSCSHTMRGSSIIYALDTSTGSPTTSPEPTKAPTTANPSPPSPITANPTTANPTTSSPVASLTCGSVVSGTTANAPVETQAALCGTSTGTGGKKWHTLVGVMGSVTVNTCGTATSYDSKLGVYSDNNSVCVGGNDDACELQSSVTFDADINKEYTVLVHGYANNEGAYQLSVECSTSSPVTSSPTPAPAPPSTSNPVTSSPTPSPVVPPPPGADLIAEFDAGYGAPLCSSVGSSCSSGNLLLGKGSNVEPNPSNTIDGCADGPYGSYQGDESNDKITVSSVNGGPLTEGELAYVDAEVWAWSSGSSDTADFYHAADATLGTNVVWTHIGSVGAGGPDRQYLRMPLNEGTGFTLSGNPHQAVRVRFRYGGSQAPCNNGNYDDADDLVFSVAATVAGNTPGTASFAAPVLEATPVSPNCDDATDEDRCKATLGCFYENNECMSE